MERESFILYSSWYDAIKLLTQEQKGELLDAIFNYHISGTTPEKSSTINLAFRFLKPAMDANISKYQAICEKNQQNGKLGGRPKKTERLLEKANGFSENPNDIDNDIEYDNVIDNVNESENKKKGLVEQAQPSSKNNFIDSIIDVFRKCYEQSRNVEYTITTIGKETKAASNLLKAFKQIHPDLNSDAMLSTIRDFFNKALQINDKFYKDSMSLSFLVSQFNQVNLKINSLSEKPLSHLSQAAKRDTDYPYTPNSSGSIPKELKEYVLSPENIERYNEVLGFKPTYLIDYFIQSNFDKLKAMTLDASAQYFVNFFKKQPEEKDLAMKFYSKRKNAEEKNKLVDEIYKECIEVVRPFIQTFRFNNPDNWFKEHISLNFTLYLERWQSTKNAEVIYEQLKTLVTANRPEVKITR